MVFVFQQFRERFERVQDIIAQGGLGVEPKARRSKGFRCPGTASVKSALDAVEVSIVTTGKKNKQ